MATGLTSAQGYYDCPYGRITSEWKCSNGQFSLHAAIPVNTTATVFIPDLRSKLRPGIWRGGLACTRSAVSSQRRQCRRL